jgi:hypothetical protein
MVLAAQMQRVLLRISPNELETQVYIIVVWVQMRKGVNYK